jgi:UDP-N-acetylglucosamine 1-carboxyvinyltransferase
MNNDKFIIEGGEPLKGTIEVKGSKNSATPIIAATLLTSEPCVIDNLPLIEDVLKMIELVSLLGAKVTWLGERKIRIEASDIDPGKIDQKLVSKMRSSVLVLGPLLARFNQVEMNHPGGCIIGTRSIDTHLDAFKEMGAQVEVSQKSSSFEEAENIYSEKTNFYQIKKKDSFDDRTVVLNEFSVTGTENVLMAAALNPGKTTIKIAACEPHVQELAEFLKKMGVEIDGQGTHTITVKGKKNLSGAEHFVSYDSVEAGTYILMASAVPGKVTIKNVPFEHLELLFKQLKSFGGNFKKLSEDSVSVEKADNLKIRRIQTWTYPGIATDLQSAFGVLATQAEGLTLIHDPIFDGRLKYLEELNKMGADIIICDPHRAVINGPTELYGTELGPLDLRGGAALIIAGLLAKGTTIIKNVSQVDRGYEKIEERLACLGARIKREK